MSLGSLPRRSLMGGLLALPLLPRAAASAAGSTGLFPTPKANLNAYVKLVGSLAPAMIYTHYQGTLYSVEPGLVPAPLVRFEALGKARWTPRDDGSFLRKSHDIGFFGDLATREPIDSFRNPLTGRVTKPLHYRNGRGETVYTATGPRLPWTGTDQDADRAQFRPDWTVMGDAIWVDDEVSGERESWLDPMRWPVESSGKRMTVRSTVTSKGRLSQLIDPAVTSADCTIVWTGLFPWLPWLAMGQRPGYLLWRSIGQKLDRPDKASRRVLDYITRAQPNYLTAEDPWMERKNSWLDYVKERQPLPMVPNTEAGP